MKEPQFLGEIFVESPLGNDIIERVMEKHNIYDVRRKKDGLKQRLLHEMDYPVDWKAVRNDLEIEIKGVPDLLPSELASFQKVLELKKSFPRELTFTDPVTDNIKTNVIALHKLTIFLIDLIAEIIGAPFQTTIDNCYSTLVENAFEYIYSGKVRDIPQNWLSAVHVLTMAGDDAVMAIANRIADQDAIVEQFRKQLVKSFGKRRPKITKKNLPYAQYFGISLRKMKIKDIADEYIQQHRRQFPKDEESLEYRRAKRRLEENLKKTVYRLKETFESMIGETIS